MPTLLDDRVVGEPSPLRVVPNTRPLLFDDDRLFCARFDTVVSTTDLGRTFEFEAQLSLPWRQQLYRLSPLGQRVARMMIYRMRTLPNGNRVYIFRGGLYTQPAGKRQAERTHRVERGSRPVSLAVDPDAEQIVFGEYFSNPERGPVHVFGSRDGMTWSVVYTFPAGSIRHIHGVAHDPWRGGFWICTGDDDHENLLLWADAQFKDVEVVRRGGQQNRFYSLQVFPDVIVTATDTPRERNHITVIDKSTGEARSAAELENTSFYGCSVDGKVALSTNAEPGVGDTSASHVWFGDPEQDDWRRVVSFPVDAYERFSQLPSIKKGLFQYPRVFFPEGENRSRTLVCQTIGVRQYANAMLAFDTSSWERRCDRQAA